MKNSTGILGDNWDKTTSNFANLLNVTGGHFDGKSNLASYFKKGSVITYLTEPRCHLFTVVTKLLANMSLHPCLGTSSQTSKGSSKIKNIFFNLT